MPEYHQIQSPFGTLWLHRCRALNHGPDWAHRERLIIDAGANESRLEFQGKSINFHGHLFRKVNGSFRFSDTDRQKYPTALLDELERIVNGLSAARS